VKPINSKWHYLLFTLYLAVPATPIVFFWGHLAFNIPFAKLWYPAISFTALSACLAPLIELGRNKAKAHPRDLRLLYFSIGLVCILASLLADFWAMRFGIVSRDTAEGYALTCLIAGPPSIVLGYYMGQQFFKS
jgi:hypothetical protein